MKKLTTTWDLSPLYKNDNDPRMDKDRKEIEKNCDAFVKKWGNRTDFLEEIDVLKNALDDYERWNRFFEGGGKEWYYFYLRNDQDQSNPKLRAKLNKVQNFKQTIDDKMRFFYLALAKISPVNQKKFLAAPKLQVYKHYLERIFAEAAYLLSDKEEKIMSMKSTPAYGNWVKMVASFISKEERELLLENGKREVKSFSDVLSLVDSTKKDVRDIAAKALNTILEKHIDVAVEEINSILEHKRTDDEIRHMPRPDYARHISDDIESSVVDTVLDVVSKHNSIAHRFYQLKAKLLGLKKLEYHERNVQYGSVDKDFSYKDAVTLLQKVFKDLDPEFEQIFSEFAYNGHIDVYPSKGKRGGAFCAYHLQTLPTYVLLNYAGKLDDVLTIAHEMGHGINDELMKKKQHALAFGTPLATAEVASTFMEDFVLEEIVKTADDEMKLSILMMKLNSDISSIFRQVACYTFEQKLHQAYRKNGYLSKEEIGKLFSQEMVKYMGPAVEQSPGSQNWWVYWWHIRYFFYVYSYASGLLISKALQRMVKKDRSTIKKVKEFLSTGLSESPQDIFLKLGIDISKKTFWEQGLKEIEDLLVETEKMARHLKKI